MEIRTKMHTFKQWKIKRRCLRKKRYDDKDGALSNIRYQQAKRKTTPQLSAYECKICGGWHLSKHMKASNATL